MSKAKILITAGGTGGHLFPAQGFAQELLQLENATEILFAGGGLSTSPYFDGSAFPFEEIAAAPFPDRNLRKALGRLGKMAKGFYQSVRLLKSYHPAIVVGFGSFYTVPVLLAARWLGIPYVLHEANSIPGKANRLFAPGARWTGIHFPSSSQFIKGKTKEAGLPLRSGYRLNQVAKEEALAYFQLSSSQPVLLVFGGSQGAQGINAFMKKGMSQWCKRCQVIHLIGSKQSEEEYRVLYAQYGFKARVKNFENNMQLAWRAADLFMGRSGASTIAEAIEFETPGVLIPYPFATDGHQEMNADFFTETVGGGIKLCEKKLGERALCEIDTLFEEMLARRKKIQNYKSRPGRQTLAQLVMEEIG